MRAYIFREYGLAPFDTVRVILKDERTYLAGDMTWREYTEGASDPGAGIVLPAEAVEALAVAIQQFQGHASHADTEARVLREWLAVEQKRVNDALEAPR